jgi:threonine/homoserine/homoserine lactone efflux protein
VCAGAVVHALAAAFGMAALLAASATAFNLIKWAGAAYLLWLAFGLLRDMQRDEARSAAPQTSESARRLPLALAFRQGLLTNLLNPKVALFFLALLPQFIDAASAHKALAFLVLGGWLVLQSLGFLILLVLAVAPLARWRSHRMARRTLQAAGVALFVGLATRLAFAQR